MSKDVIKLEHVWKIFGENAQAAMQAIETRNLSKAQVLDEFKCVVGIADCSFSVKKGEVFCVMGLSGSGKSTMVRHVNRLIEPTTGSIEVLGKDIRALSDIELRAMRAREIGMVNTNFTNVNLTDADLTNAEMRDVNTDNAILCRTKMPWGYENVGC